LVAFDTEFNHALKKIVEVGYAYFVLTQDSRKFLKEIQDYTKLEGYINTYDLLIKKAEDIDTFFDKRGRAVHRQLNPHWRIPFKQGNGRKAVTLPLSGVNSMLESWIPCWQEMAGIGTKVSGAASADRIRGNPFVERNAPGGVGIESSTAAVVSCLLLFKIWFNMEV
jgi:hypothetical protein